MSKSMICCLKTHYKQNWCKCIIRTMFKTTQQFNVRFEYHWMLLCDISKRCMHKNTMFNIIRNAKLRLWEIETVFRNIFFVIQLEVKIVQHVNFLQAKPKKYDTLQSIRVFIIWFLFFWFSIRSIYYVASDTKRVDFWYSSVHCSHLTCSNLCCNISRSHLCARAFFLSLFCLYTFDRTTPMTKWDRNIFQKGTCYRIKYELHWSDRIVRWKPSCAERTDVRMK